MKTIAITLGDPNGISPEITIKALNNTNFTIENLFQYTDIAIFLSPDKDDVDLENSLKQVWIENINFNTKPSLGEANLYFKSINRSYN